MASTQGSFQHQSLVEKAVAFAYEEAPGIGDHIPWDSASARKIGAVNSTGDTVTIRRPGRIRGTVSDLSENTSLPDNTQPAVGYQAMTDATLPLTVSVKIEANINASMKELTLSLTKQDAYERFIKPAVVDLKDKASVEIAKLVAAQTGQAFTPDTSTYTNYHQQVINVLGRAEAQMIQRKGMSESGKKIAMLHMDVYPKLAPGASSQFNAGYDPQAMQKDGKLQSMLGGFQLFRSPVLDSVNIVGSSTLTNAKVAAPGGAVTNGLTTWAQTWSLNVKGFANSTTYPKGFKIALTGINWLMPTSEASTGKGVTFSLAAAATTDGSGNATFVLTEPLVYSGPYKNVDIATAVPTDTVITAVGASSGASIVNPCYVFDPMAIVGVSPEVAIPGGVDSSRVIRAKNGFNFAIVEDHWPGTLQSVTKLVGFLGVAVQKPEGVGVIYGL
jgi:hypothetical protein